MGKEECSSYTGISDITGKLIEIKHATEMDMFFIEEMIRKHNLDSSDLHYSQFVIAKENGNLVGLGRMKKIGKAHEIGCITVLEERKGVGALMLKHLLEVTPVKMVYVTKDFKDVLREIGFSEMKEGSKKLLDELDKACKVNKKTDMIIMVYEKG